MPTALCLCSGGQDSMLAIALLQRANIKVIALNFVSHFFGGPSERLKQFAEKMNVPIMFVPFEQAELAITLNPKFGRGKNFNACIDCHALMIRYAGRLMSRYRADFIVTGEVLNERPMSQTMQSLKNVAELSGFADYIVRPLSGQLLTKTKIEEQGLIKRSDMRAISGRGQKGQQALARELGVAYVMKQGHGGGCMLTDIEFGTKLKIIEQDGFLSESSFIPHCLQIGRVLRIGKGKYVFVGRNQDENVKFDAVKRFGTCIEADAVTPGPTMLVVEMTGNPGYNAAVPDLEKDEIINGECQWNHNGEIFKLENVTGNFPASADLLKDAIDIYSLFCKHKGSGCGEVFVNGEKVAFGVITEERRKQLRDYII